MSERSVKATVRISSLVCFALGWELFARRLDSLLLPTFAETIAALAHLLTTRDLWEAVWVSNQAMVLGFLLAAVFGIMLGLLMGRWRAAERYVDTYLNILLATPKSALIPIVVMAAGLGLLSRVLVVFISAVVAITVNVRAGLRMIDPAWVEMAHSFGATEAQMWRKILLRGALPAIITGLRLGLARSISAMLMVELVLLALGFGRLILDFRATFESPQLYATVMVIIGEAVLLMHGCKWLERRATPWLGKVEVE